MRTAAFGVPTAIVAIVVGVAGPLAGGEVSLRAPLAVARDGAGASIRFEVSGPTDVEVAILDAEGKVARHLAAGVLGGSRPPPEPLRPGLAQSIPWDGRDDRGNPATRGPFRARVRAGTGVRFGRFIGESPYAFGTIVSMAADETGHLWVLGRGANRNQDFTSLRVFDSRGRYLREAMPFPADLAPAEVGEIAVWNAERKAFQPRNLSSLNPEFYPGKTPSLVSASSKAGFVLSDGRVILRFTPRGGAAGPALRAEPLWPEGAANPNTGDGPVFLAASPDGKTVYLSGPFSSKTQYGHPYLERFPPGRVYRRDAAAGSALEPFVTIPVDHAEGQGGAWTKRNYKNHAIAEGPVHGVAVDAAGRVYVADRQHGRVAVFDAGGAEVGRLEVPDPHQVAVHPVTGEVWVLSRGCPGYWRYRVAAWKFAALAAGSRLLAKHEFPEQKGAWPQMALVASELGTSAFVAGVTGGLVSLVDRGDRIEPVATELTPPSGALDVFNRMEVDRDRDEVYVSDGGNLYWRFDGRTGEGRPLEKDGKPFLATDLAVGWDGLLYLQTGEGFSGPLERLTRDLEPAPYPAGTHVLSPYIYGRYGIGNCEKGMGVGPDGTIYVSWMFGGWVKYAVTAWGPDGKPIEGRHGEIAPDHHGRGVPADLTRAVIAPIPQANGGVRVDSRGNVYVGMTLGKPPVPEAFAGDEAYAHCTGSVVKFGPEGGSVLGAPDMMVGSAVEGALATYPGLSPLSRPSLGTTCCVCRVPRFDVDRWGRLAIPNATGNLVRLVDNAGNEILSFGAYGNFDSRYVNPAAPEGARGEPTVAVPEIPLAWPTCAGLTDDHVYVLDVYARRVVRVDLVHRLEETCSVP